jgi:hypothetical protein|tara:strand:+ start:309 stop:539 length:231 start_codon:yes stop_codon:yes gene_type:complete
MIEVTKQAQWDMVGNYFNDNNDLCEDCMHCNKVYYSDTGWDFSCELLQGSYGDPEECLGLEYMVECLEEELEECLR